MTTIAPSGVKGNACGCSASSSARCCGCRLDDPPRQPPAAQPRRAQGRRPPGLVRLAGDGDDGALLLGAAARGSGGGEAARLAGVPRHPVPVRPPDAREARALPRAGRRAVLSVAHQGHRRRRFLDRLGRAGRRDDAVRLDRAGLCAAEAARRRRTTDRPHGRAGRRRRARRRQHLRGAARRLEARRAEPVVGDRLQPPEPRRRGQRPAVRPHRRDVRAGRLARRDAEVRQAAWRRPSPSPTASICGNGSTTAPTRSTRRWSSRAARAGARR